MFGSRFLNNNSKDLEKSLKLWKGWFKCFISCCVTCLIFLLLDPDCGLGGPAVVYAMRKWLFSYYCRVQVAHSSATIRTWACTNVFGTSSGISVVAFRNAPPNGGLSCCHMAWKHHLRLELEARLFHLIEWKANETEKNNLSSEIPY